MHSAAAEESKRALAVVVLAAGLGTRMKSNTPKVLHTVCGRPMISWVTDAAGSLHPDRMVIVLAPGMADQLHQTLPQEALVAIQQEQLGTGDALRAAEEQLKDFSGDVLVMYGDTPLMTGDALAGLAAAHRQSRPACTLMTVSMPDPTHYGRILRDADGRVRRIVEERDATPDERRINEINAGIYIFDSSPLWGALSRIGSENDQGEFYLTDVAAILSGAEETVLAHHESDAELIMGVNSRSDLARAAAAMRRRILERLMADGVTVIDPATTYVDAGVSIGRDTTLQPMTMLLGNTSIGDDCVIGPSCTIADSVIDDGVTVISSYITSAEIASGCQVGPFAYLRPGARLAEGAKAGTFVEIKNSEVGAGSKVPHLSYIGDATIGSGSNIGAGNITANYDGVRKHRTEIGSHVHTGADTVFVAPVKVGDGAMTGAGSAITGDVPEGALGIGRARQKNIEGYAARKLGGKKE